MPQRLVLLGLPPGGAPEPLPLAAPLAATVRAHPTLELRTYDDTDADGVGDAIRARLDRADTLPANGRDDALVAGPPVSPK